MKERWLPVVGFEGLYDVSDTGRVRSLGRIVLAKSRWGSLIHKLTAPKVMKQSVGCKSKSPRGYLGVTLTPWKTGGRRHLVHHLVLAAFRGARPVGYDGAHDNGKHFDNRLQNLFWKSKKENSDDAFRHGVRRQDPSASNRFARTYA